MNKDQVEGKVKDIAGRVQRQAGEWSADPEQQVKGAAKQAEGKVQNTWGKGKDAAKDAAVRSQSSAKPSQSVSEDENDTRRTGS